MKNRVYILFCVFFIAVNAYAQAGNALNFDGTNDYVSFSNTLGQFGTSDFTIEAYIRTNNSGVINELITKRNSFSHGNFFRIFIDASGKINAALDDNTSNYILVTSSQSVVDNNWHLISVTRSGGTVKIYIDGNLDGSLTNTNGTADITISTPMVIGTVSLGSGYLNFFKGDIDEVRIWSIARTQTEIQDAMNNPISASTSGLTAYYSFDEGTAGSDNSSVTTLNDETTNGNNGTLTNFDLTGSTSNWVTSAAPLPVELNSFNASHKGGSVILNWQTATEVNNYGFEILRRSTPQNDSHSESVSADEESNWIKIGFVQGHGNSNSPKSYSFADNSPLSGNYSYRLKQIDFDGKFEFSPVVNISVEETANFSLEQNHPNPFNPTTTISFTIPNVAGATHHGGQDFTSTTLKVYDVLGEEVATLVNEQKPSGHYEVNFNASNLASGIYFYKLTAGNFVQSKKMMVIK